MASKDQQAYHPPATNGYSRSDEEANATQAKQLRNQKYKKWAIYGIAFIIFQSGIIALFSMTIMKVRTPKFVVKSGSFDTTNIPSGNTKFNLNTTIVFGIKNTNFGPYKYDNSTTVDFYYGDSTLVGSAMIKKSKAQFRRTKKVTVEVELAMDRASNPQLASDITNGTVLLSSQGRLNGKVELMLIFKKKKAVNMNCTMELNTTTKMLQNINCK